MQKKTLREAAIARREALAADLRERLEARIRGHLEALIGRLAPTRLGFCWPFRCEPDLRPLVETWLAAAPGRIAALPVIVTPAAAMIFRQWHAECKMVRGQHGILHPLGTPETLPEVVLVPLNAFDQSGFRVGYGGGFFDRTLATLAPRPLAVGVGYECGRVASALPEAHDLPMDWLVTEGGAIEIPRGHA